MNEKVKNEAKELVEFVQSLPAEERERSNREGMEKAKAEYRQFVECFRTGKCSVCGDALASFDPARPCLHWLLVPDGFTKWHFMAVARRYGMFPMQLFLRRVANEDAVARNINDLSDEGTGKLIELTIRWGDYEWAFSCSDGDYKGHENGAVEAQRPHFHFQMRYKKQAFIRYNEFHVPLSDKDIFTIEAKRAAPEFVSHHFMGGEGMSDLLDEKTLEHMIAAGQSTRNADEASMRLSTIIMADEGHTIDGDELNAIFGEAREKGVTVASLIKGRLQKVNIMTIVSPGDGVVEQAPRAGGRGGKRKK